VHRRRLFQQALGARAAKELTRRRHASALPMDGTAVNHSEKETFVSRQAASHPATTAVRPHL